MSENRVVLRTVPVLVVLLALVASLTAGCTPRPKPDPGVPTPPPGTAWPLVKNESGSLTTSGGVTTYEDRSSAFALTVPEGFTGRMSFAADPSGPPVQGAVKLRLSDGGKPPCVIDIAVEPLRDPSTLASTIAAGREVFYLSETGAPRPDAPGSIEPASIWSATLVPATADTRDLGTWIFTAENVLRVEGRFPVSRIGACKDSLDAIVRSLRSSDSSRSAADRPAASR